jgi:hypothetical protein
MRAPERLHGFRFVASPAALDALDAFGLPAEGAAAGAYEVLRLAPDDLLLIGPGSFAWAGEPAIVEEESGFVGWWLELDELHDDLREQIDWPLPETLPALAQGLIAGVPAKLWLTNDRALLFCAAAYAHELQERLP